MRENDIEKIRAAGLEPVLVNRKKLVKTAWWIVVFGLLSAVIVLWNYSIASANQNNSERPAYHGNVFLNLKTIRHDGKIAGFEEFEGKVWIIQPHSVTQPETCQLGTTVIKDLCEKYKDRKDVAFISLVIDPGKDVEALENLKKAAEKNSASIPQWYFATTEPAVLHKYLKDKCRLGTLPYFKDGKWLYDSSLILVDRKMKLRRAVVPQEIGGRPFVTGFDFQQAAEWDAKGIKTGTDCTNQQEMQSLIEKTIDRLLAETDEKQ